MRAELVWPRIDFNNPRHRNIAFLVTIATFINVLIVSLAAYTGVHYMDSNEFCGQVCHTVMEPEYAAFQDGAHSRVGCVQCHIGPGAPWFVQAKISGLRQVVAVHAEHVLAADSVAGAQPAPRARNLRAVPLAREVPRRQGQGHPRVRRRRGQHGEHDDPADSRRRRQRQALDRDRHPLAHERRQRGRVHPDRRQAAGHPLGARSRTARATSANTSRTA